MNEELRIITLWQPWASLIALGLKRYETRSWATSYRGKLAIHAAKRPMKHDELMLVSKSLPSSHHDLMQQFWQASLHDTPTMKKIPLGAIVAIVDLVDCRQMISGSTTLTSFGKHPESVQAQQIPIISLAGATDLEKAVGDWQPGRYAWRLENIQALLKPIPFKGGQGLRKLEDLEVKQAIAQALPMEEAA